MVNWVGQCPGPQVGHVDRHQLWYSSQVGRPNLRRGVQSAKKNVQGTMVMDWAQQSPGPDCMAWDGVYKAWSVRLSLGSSDGVWGHQPWEKRVLWPSSHQQNAQVRGSNGSAAALQRREAVLTRQIHWNVYSTHISALVALKRQPLGLSLNPCAGDSASALRQQSVLLLLLSPSVLVSERVNNVLGMGLYNDILV